MNIAEVSKILNQPIEVVQWLVDRNIIQASAGGDITGLALQQFRSNPRRLASAKTARQELAAQAESDAVKARESEKMRNRKIGILKSAFESGNLDMARELAVELFESVHQGDDNE